MEIHFPTHLEVTKQNIDVSFLTDMQKEFYINLFEEITALYSSVDKKRMIIGFAGPTGAGKSVTLALFKDLAKQYDLPFKIITLGIDAYSYTNEYLLSQQDNEKTLKDSKGRFDTYDVNKLKNDLNKFLDDKDVSLPEYSRVTHNPIENTETIHDDSALLLIEGLWLLYDKNNWNEINPLLDYTIFITAEKERVRNATIKRHVTGGRTEEEASKYYDEIDSHNFDIVMETKEKANRIIPSYHEL